MEPERVRNAVRKRERWRGGHKERESEKDASYAFRRRRRRLIDLVKNPFLLSHYAKLTFDAEISNLYNSYIPYCLVCFKCWKLAVLEISSIGYMRRKAVWWKNLHLWKSKINRSASWSWNSWAWNKNRMLVCAINFKNVSQQRIKFSLLSQRK